MGIFYRFFSFSFFFFFLLSVTNLLIHFHLLDGEQTYEDGEFTFSEEMTGNFFLPFSFSFFLLLLLLLLLVLLLYSSSSSFNLFLFSRKFIYLFISLPFSLISFSLIFFN